MKDETPIIQSDAVRAIQDGVKTDIIKIGDVEYVTRQVFEPPKGSLASTLKIHTLAGLVAFYNNERSCDFDTIHIVDESTVQVISGLSEDRFKQRDIFAVADAGKIIEKGFTFGHFYDIESFIIALQTLFVETPVRGSLLALVGNIKNEKVINASDDGVTQTVTARKGIALVTEADVPNPVSLMPYRTFRELDQPKSPFILRLREGREGSLPTAALFEADGGAWKLQAIEAIRDYLQKELPNATIIA